MKRIALVTTGGTIAGLAASDADPTNYTAAALGIDQLLAAVPTLVTLADIVPEALYSIDSKDALPEHWLQLARRVDALLGDPAIDGVVITHGTDTLEESAFFLQLVLPTGKPVVFTGAMRPANARSADGPLNLYQAVAVAASGVSAEVGVVVVMNGEIHGAREVHKTHTLAPSAFSSPNAGPLGRADPPVLLRRPNGADGGSLPLARLVHTEPLPEVALLTVASGVGPIFLQAVAQHCAGVVLALPGHGSLPAAWRGVVDQLAQRGLPMIRSSRTGAGPVLANGDHALWPAGDLGPSKARIALIVALAAGQAALFKRVAGVA